jgi:hypothetical protein
MFKALLLVFFCLSSYCSLGQQQYVGHYTLPVQRKAITLTDAATGNRFVLDSTRITVAAFSPQGVELWKTDAWKDNQLEAYRVSRPVISYFAFGKDVLHKRKKKEVIWIKYNNTQFGFLDKQTGAFIWLGQD